jgi:hypothetical protein
MDLQAPPLHHAPMRPRVPTFHESRAPRAFSAGAKECKVVASATDAEQDAGAVGDEKDLYAAAGGDAKRCADQERLLKSLEETLEKHSYGG